MMQLGSEFDCTTASLNEQILTLDLEHGGGQSGVSLLDAPQPPKHLHRLGGANCSTGEVEGDIGESGHVLGLLDKVRDP